MAEQHTLTVKVTGDSSQLVAALNKAQAELAQLDRQSNGAIGGMDDLARASTGTGGALSGMGSMLAGIGWAGAIAGAVALGTELYNVGRASQVALNTFTQLQGGAEQASASLQMLREATNFTVPDTTLMSISNLYTQMGLATDPAEVARLAQMGAELGMAMGQSAEEAMRTFSALLANQSIELLDQFGISSGKVRDRIKELQEANQGLARDQAFVTAVLEIGAVAQERINVAIEKNVSSVAQLTTRFQNLMAEMGKPIASAVESVAGGIEGILSDADRVRAIEDEIKAIAQLNNLSVMRTMGGGLFGMGGGSFDTIINQTAQLVASMGDYTSALRQAREELGLFPNPILNEQIILLEQLIQLQNRRARSNANIMAIPEPDVRQALQVITALDLATQELEMRQGLASNLSSQLSTGLLTNTELQQSSRFIEDITARIDELLNQSVPEDNPTVVALQKMRDELSGIADNAIRARNEMSLTTALGLGLPPEQRLTADILTAAGIGGRQAEFLTGQRTISSEMFDERVLPLIQAVGETFGEDEAAILGDRIADLMRAGIARGLENNPVDLISFIMRGAGYDLESGEGRSVVVQAGDTLSSIAAREGVTVEFLAAINKLEDPNMILTGSELVVEVGARITRVLPFTPEDEEYLPQSTLDMIYGGQAPTNEGELVTPLGPTSMGIDETLATAQELQTLMSEIVPPLITPARMGLVSGDVAEVGSLEVVNMIDAKLKEISSRIYQVSMTVNLDANIRTGAGFKIIPITMAELANDISESARVFRLAQGAY